MNTGQETAHPEDILVVAAISNRFIEFCTKDFLFITLPVLESRVS